MKTLEQDPRIEKHEQAADGRRRVLRVEHGGLDLEEAAGRGGSRLSAGRGTYDRESGPQRNGMPDHRVDLAGAGDRLTVHRGAVDRAIDAAPLQNLPDELGELFVDVVIAKRTHDF